jgi:hypothetical protein
MLLLRLLLPCLAAFALPALAGEPLATEDASILPKGACQLETWVRHERHVNQFWALPACSPNEHVELALGGAIYRDEETGRHAVLQLQAKPILYRDPGERYAVAALFAAVRDTGREHVRGGFHESLAALVASFDFPDSALRVHVNAGIGHSHREFTTAIYGAAIEFDAAARWTLLAEVFRDAPGRPNAQAGVRYTVIEDALELFASIGERIGGGGDGPFVKAGLRLQGNLLR